MHLHWDLRLEVGGVLKSWAIPKSPLELKRRGVKRLAIPVADHDLDYADFERKISNGYGKGDVKIWDKGSYELEKINSKEIKFKLNGEKLNGNYVLLKTGYGKDKKGWLIMRI